MGVAATSMTRFVLLLLVFLTVKCSKQQQLDSKDDTLVNVAGTKTARDAGGTCAQHRQLNYPCNNQIIDANENICNDYGTPIENSARNDYTNCCCRSTCSYNNNITSDGVGASNLNMTWSALNRREAALMVDWTRPSSGGLIGFQLWIFITQSTGPVYNYGLAQKQRCICLPPSTRSYRGSVTMTLSFYIHIKLFSIVRPEDQPCDVDYDNNNVLNVTKKIPFDCWKLEGASVEKCGPMFASAPQNLTATSTLVDESTVMLQISWLPPAQYDPDITMYTISINGDHYCTNGTTLQYVTTGSTDVHIYEVQVAASSGVVTSYHGIDKCSPPCCADYSSCNCFSAHASVTHSLDHTTSNSISSSTTVVETVITTVLPTNTITTTTSTSDGIENTSISPTRSSVVSSVTTNVFSHSTFNFIENTRISPTQSSIVSSSVVTNVSSHLTTEHTTHNTVLVIILYTLIAITVVLIVFVILVAVHLRWRRTRVIYKLVPPKINESVIQEPQPKAFIISDKNSESVRRLCHRLGEYGIDPVYYQYVENDRIDGPGRLGTPAWAEKCFKESSMILFVCNEGFNNIWDNGNIRQDSYAEIISITKVLFHGCVTENNLSNFAVVLLQESDHQYIPHLLRNIKSFSVGDEEGLARYILQVPTHAPPSCANNN